MKKIFTLIAGMLLATSAFGQAKWTSVITNGDFEGDDLSCFTSVEDRDGEKGQGAPTVIEDPLQEGNHCVVVKVRSKEESGESDDLQRYDTQFFFSAPEEIPAGKMLRISLRIRAVGSTSFGTQLHAGPQQYIDYNTFGEHQISEEWKTITFSDFGEKQIPVDDSWKNSDTGYGVRSVALDLTTNQDGATFYIDDIVFEVKDGDLPKEFTGWFDLIRNSDLSSDDCSQFIARNGDEHGMGLPDRPADKVIDEKDGKPSVIAKSISTETYNVLGISGTFQDWQSQFFVTSGHVFKTGMKIKFTFEARADYSATIATQIHKAPGTYISHGIFGDINLTEDYQPFEFEQEITSAQNDGWTITFNLNNYRDNDNIYYFRNIHLYCNEADVNDATRTIASQEVELPVPIEADGEKAVTLDLSNAVAMLGITDFAKFVSGKNLKIGSVEGSLSSAISFKDDIFINENGELTSDETAPIYIELLSSDADAKTITLNIFNNGGQSFEGKEIKSRLCFVNSDEWYYGFNVSFKDENAIGTGIRDMKVSRHNDGIIYDLMGRRVNNPSKGIYIQNGKKFILR